MSEVFLLPRDQGAEKCVIDLATTLLVRPCRYQLTVEEIAAVTALSRQNLQNAHWGMFCCMECARPVMYFSRDTGMDYRRWYRAAAVLRRLHHRREFIGVVL